MAFSFVSSPFDGANGVCNSIAWSPALPLFIAVGRDIGNTFYIASSPTGAVWTAETHPAGFAYGTGVAWAPSLGIFVATSTGTNPVCTSPDGTMWTSQVTPWDSGAGYGPVAVAWSPALSQFVATGQGVAGSVLTSPDGINWTEQSTPFDGFTTYGVGWDSVLGLWIVGGGSGFDVITSPDGFSWTQRATGGVSTVAAVKRSPTAGAALIANQGIYSSVNATAWTHQTSAFDSGNCYAIEDDGATIMAVGVISTGETAELSVDGAVWSPCPTPFDNASQIQAAAYSPGLDVWVIGGYALSGLTETIAIGFPESPEVLTQPATAVTTSALTMHGLVNPAGVNSRAYFQYGRDTSYGFQSAPQAIGAGSSAVPVSQTLTSLGSSTTYHYRVVRDDVPIPGDFGSALPPRLAESTGSIVNVSNFADLADAVAFEPNGTFVNVTASINNGGGVWNVTRAASAGAPITVTCDPGVLLTNFSQINITGSYLRFRGLEVSNATIDNFKCTGTANFIEIDGCHIHNATRMGILITASAASIQIWNNRIHNNGSILNLDHGIYFSYCRGNCVIANNLLYDNWAYNVQIYPDSPNMIFTCNTVDGGLIHANARGGVVCGSENGLTDNVIMVGLLTTNAPQYGVLPYDPAGGDTNNNCYDALGFGNGSGDFASGGGFTYTNCSHADPLYVNRAAKNYHLQAGSPAIDLAALRADYVPPFDIEGNARTTADAGCYAF